MGRLIDADTLEPDTEWNEYEDGFISYSKMQIDNAETIKVIPKDQYEARLKTDMVAMLTEIQLEIEEREQYYKDKFLESSNAVHESAMSGRMFGCGDCKELIQQKIDKLREVEQ